jgi:hypothetical protein
MSSSRQGGTKLQNRVIRCWVNSSNEHVEVILSHCYCDQARLAVTERSNGRADSIDMLLL